MRVISFVSLKGGVGKSVLAAHLAATAANGGTKTAVLDWDAVAPVQSLVLGQDEDLMVFTDVSAAPRMCWPEAELVVIDLGPRLGHEFESALQNSDVAVMVTTLEPQAVLASFRTARTIKGLMPSLPIGIVFNLTPSPGSHSGASKRLVAMCQRFLGFEPELLGFVPEHGSIRSAWLRQELAVQQGKSSALSKSFESLLERIESIQPALPAPTGLLISLREPVASPGEQAA